MTDYKEMEDSQNSEWAIFLIFLLGNILQTFLSWLSNLDSLVELPQAASSERTAWPKKKETLPITEESKIHSLATLQTSHALYLNGSLASPARTDS